MRTENFLWIGKNFIRMILLLAAVSVVTFTLVSISPIDPLQANVGQTALGSMSEEQIEKLQSYWGVDTPPLERYLNWAKDFVRGDMGVSLLYRQSVSEVIKVKLGNSLTVISDSMADLGLLGFLLGILAGVFRGSWIDKLIKGIFVVDRKYTGVLAGVALIAGIFRMVKNISDRTECSDRCGSGRRYLAGSSVSCRTACDHTQHYGCCKYCNAYQRKNDRCHGE